MLNNSVKLALKKLKKNRSLKREEKTDVRYLAPRIKA
jgi:hypothetical protein